MKGDIVQLEELEQKCFSLRQEACESQQTLLKQQEAHAKLIKEKIYVDVVDPELKNEMQIRSVQLLSAANYDFFEQRKEVNLVNSSDVIVGNEEGDGPPPVQSQLVLMEPSLFFN